MVNCVQNNYLIEKVKDENFTAKVTPLQDNFLALKCLDLNARG